ESISKAGQRAGAGERLNRIAGGHPPPGELLGGFRGRHAVNLVPPYPPVVGYAHVRVSSLDHRVNWPQVIPPEHVEPLSGNWLVQVEQVEHGTQLHVLEFVDKEQ